MSAQGRLTDEMTFAVNQDVAVVSILELEEIADDGIRRERLDKVVLRGAERLRGGGAIGLKGSVDEQ